MAKKNDEPKAQPIKGRCTSVQCSHVSSGHCGYVACGNYSGDCPVHG